MSKFYFQCVSEVQLRQHAKFHADQLIRCHDMVIFGFLPRAAMLYSEVYAVIVCVCL